MAARLAFASRALLGAAAAALDPWLPRACALCDAVLSRPDTGLCRHCRLALPGRTRERCARCALGRVAPAGAATGSFDGSLAASLAGSACRASALPATDCPACAEHDFAFDATRVLADYAPPLDRLIGALKFGGHLASADALGRELARALRRAPDAAFDLVTAVPLSVERRQQRGYDQARAIARALGRACGIAHRPLLIRLRNTRAQSGLPRPERAANLRDAFGTRPGLRLDGAHIALVDDVMTTGATLDAAARALRQAGARRITALAVARTA